MTTTSSPGSSIFENHLDTWKEEGRRVGTEHGPARVRAREVRGRSMRLWDGVVRLLAPRECTVHVAQPSPIVIRHGIDHGVRDLGAARRVCEHRRPPVVADAGQRGEPGTDASDVQHDPYFPQPRQPGIGTCVPNWSVGVYRRRVLGSRRARRGGIGVNSPRRLQVAPGLRPPDGSEGDREQVDG